MTRLATSASSLLLIITVSYGRFAYRIRSALSHNGAR